MYLLLEFAIIGVVFLLSMCVCFAMNKDVQSKKIKVKVK